jgi:hypothetical protein
VPSARSSEWGLRVWVLRPDGEPRTGRQERSERKVTALDVWVVFLSPRVISRATWDTFGTERRTYWD